MKITNGTRYEMVRISMSERPTVTGGMNFRRKTLLFVLRERGLAESADENEIGNGGPKPTLKKNQRLIAK